MLAAKTRKQFEKLVKNNDNFIVCGHQGPDGDVVGSTLGVVLGLKALKKKAIAFNEDGCPPYLSFLPKSKTIKNQLPKTTKDKILITVDSGDLARLGPIGEQEFKEVWNIDHHKSNTKFGKYNFIDIGAGSTGQVVYDLFSPIRGFKLTSDVANALFCTLSTDTGSFRYSNSTSEVFGLASLLVGAGAKPHTISQALYETYSQRRLTLMRRVLESLSFEHGGQFAKMFLTLKDLEETGATSDDSEEFVNLPRGVVGVKVVCFIKEKTPTEWKISFRARTNENVLKLAKSFGGGGHKLAAGCTIEGSRQQVEEMLNKAVAQSGYLK